jgi:hypothetical protein
VPLTCPSRHPRSPTATDILVRYNRWMMLEPRDSADHVSRGVSRAAGAASLASQALYRHHQKEEVTDDHAATLFKARLEEAERLLASSARRGDVLDGRDILLSGRAAAAGAGEAGKIRASDSVLEQLAERKWERLYSVLFVRLALFRALCVLVAWGLLVVRSGAPLDLSVCSADYPASFCTPYGKHSLQALIAVLAAGSACVFAVNALPFLCYVLLPACAAVCRSALKMVSSGKPQEVKDGDPDFNFVAECSDAKPRVTASREKMLYVAAHGQTFGLFYILSLLCGSGLLCCGALVDLFGGGYWSSAFISECSALRAQAERFEGTTYCFPPALRTHLHPLPPTHTFSPPHL